eukprot:1195962-Prorocentrum_minimum.AAC.6
MSSAESPVKKPAYATGTTSKFSTLKNKKKIVTSLTDSGKFKQRFTAYNPSKPTDLLQIVLVRQYVPTN